MKLKKKLILNAFLLLSCIFIRIYSADPIRVETGYSTRFYPAIARFFRASFGSVPFSIGDLLYAAIAIYLAILSLRALRSLSSKAGRLRFKYTYKRKLLTLLQVLMIIYIVFNLFWGINYNRVGIAAQLGIELSDYTRADLDTMNSLLLVKVNATRSLLTNSSKNFSGNKEIFAGVDAAYQNISSTYPFLSYNYPSMKPSMFGWFGSYSGFSGYYNPFTGEGQLNTDMPQFTQPFTACHGAAHSIGYAKEMEANFAGYLAASASADVRFRYSVYLDLFLYANRSLAFKDTISSSGYRKMLSPAVTADLEELREFSRKHRSIMAPLLRLIYGKYLESNQQPKGIDSYDEVTAFIIAYYKKYGKI